jgi:hypothetical protein
MCRYRERKVIGFDARAIIAHADQPCATGFDVDLDAGGAGVEAVLDELLYNRSRPLDDFAGGDLVDEFGGELTDARHGGTTVRMRMIADARALGLCLSRCAGEAAPEGG